MRRTRKKKKKFSVWAIRLGLVFVCVYLGVSLISVQMEILAKRQQLDNVNQQVSAQQAENDEMRRTLDTDDEASYMERLARSKLEYALPNERVFVDMSGD
ncbi:septum formation initiator family protein [uncultured Ruthenibacterium sp.]|uniref:FtsB family cell division protein n=1 Tax=uncultured Ruthenibacterium sp. TaxID=1905347 RepID=UPI00349ECE19